MKAWFWIASLVLLAGCSTFQLGYETSAYEGKWCPVVQGDTSALSGNNRMSQYLADEGDAAGALSQFLKKNGLPDYLYVMDTDKFRLAYSRNATVYEWESLPYRVVKTYSWQNCPDERPPGPATAQPATPPEVTKPPVAETPKPPPTETTQTPPAPSAAAQSAYETALKYQYGEGVAQSDAEAAKWFRQAADQGHVDAQYQMGILCQKGWGVARNEEEARRWFRQAAAQGHALARAKLGENAPVTPAPKPESKPPSAPATEPKPKPVPPPPEPPQQSPAGMPKMPD